MVQNRNLTIEQQNFLIQNFGKKSVKELQIELNIKNRSIVYFYQKNKLLLTKEQKFELSKRRIKKYNCNVNFFNSSFNANYWAGFIAADGCILKNHFQIKLKSTDKQHLEQFLQDINSNHKIYTDVGYRNGIKTEGSVIHIRESQMLLDLLNIYNLTQKKSLTLIPPNLIDVLQIDQFIKGYFDGDGTIYVKKNKYLCVRFYGTYEINEWIKNRINIIYNKNSGCLFKKENIYCFELNPRASLFFINYYRKINTPELKRKWYKSLEIENIINKNIEEQN